MDTALVTGMFETQFLPRKQVKMDVEQESQETFSKIFKSFNSKDVDEEVRVEDVQKEDVDEEVRVEDVQKEDVEEEGLVNEDDGKVNAMAKVEDGDEEKDEKTKKKDEKEITKQSMSGLLINENMIKDVEKEEEKGIEDIQFDGTSNFPVRLIETAEKEGISPEEKLDGLLNKLDVKIKDDSEKVIEVGPQSVETEKIELNIKDVEMDIDDDATKEPVVLFVAKNEVADEKVVIRESSEEGDLPDIETDVEKEEYRKIKKVNQENKTDVQIQNGTSIKDVVNTNKKDMSNSEKNPDKKEEKIKVKDFRNKKEFEPTQGTVEDVKVENKFETKDVTNIRKFENLYVEQDILDQVTEKMEVSLFDNKSEMVIKLKPNDLGQVTIKISIENGIMNAKFLADSMKVKEALESNLSNLKESLKEQGLDVQALSVSVDNGRSQEQSFAQNRGSYNKEKGYKVGSLRNYDDTYYEIGNNQRAANGYWMDSTVSFLA